MKNSANILQSIGKTDTTTNLQPLQSTLRHAAFNGIPYRSMMNMLEEYKLPSEPLSGAKFNKKLKLKDSHKAICRIITHTFKTASNLSTSNDQEKFTKTANRIRKGIATSQSILEEHSQSNKQQSKKTHSNPKQSSVNIVEIDDSPSPLQPSTDTSSAGVSKNLDRLRNQVLADGEFVSDDAITTAVEVLRQDMERHNTFIANGLANVIIDDWTPTSGWERFGRMFNSQSAVFTKPNGTYIIPMYRPGHWYLVVLHKYNRTRYEGWILDSLRKGEINSTTHNKIKEAFTGNRGGMIWHTPQCFKQTENECGPRTIRSIQEVTKGISNSVSIEECIRKATLTHTGISFIYDAKDRRRDMATLLGRHCQSMRSRRIRFTQTGMFTASASQNVRKKFRRKRHSK